MKATFLGSLIEYNVQNIVLMSERKSNTKKEPVLRILILIKFPGKKKPIRKGFSPVNSFIH